MRRETRLQICLYHILYIGEVTALLSVTVYCRSLSLQQLLDELRYHRSVCPVRVLSSAEHVEVSEPVGIQPVVPRVLLRPLLVSPLRYRIGRQQITLSALGLRQVRLIPVYGGARSIDELLHLVLPGCLQHVESSRYIVRTVEERHLYGAGHRAPGRLMKHIVHALTGFHAGVGILYIPLCKLI